MLHVAVANPTWLKVRQLLQLFRVRVRVWYGTAICLSGTHTAHIFKYSCRYSNSHTHTVNENWLINTFDVAVTVNREREGIYTLKKIKIMEVRTQQGLEKLIGRITL